MTCKELTNDLLLDYADWQLAPHERNRVVRHLDVCEPCRGRRDDLDGMAAALRHSTEAPPAALMAQLDKSVLAALPQTRQAAPPPGVPRPKLLLWPLAVAGVAALVAIAAVSIVVGDRMTRPRAPAVVRDTPRPDPEPRREPPVEPARRPDVERVPAPDPLPTRPEPRPIREEPAPEPKPAPVIAQEPRVTAPNAAPRVLPGDLNGDGVVDIADARILQQMITHGLQLPENADVNADGMVDVADVREIIRAELALR